MTLITALVAGCLIAFGNAQVERRPTPELFDLDPETCTEDRTLFLETSLDETVDLLDTCRNALEGLDTGSDLYYNPIPAKEVDNIASKAWTFFGWDSVRKDPDDKRMMESTADWLHSCEQYLFGNAEEEEEEEEEEDVNPPPRTPTLCSESGFKYATLARQASNSAPVVQTMLGYSMYPLPRSQNSVPIR